MKLLSRHFKVQLSKGLMLGLLIGLFGILLAVSPAGRWLEEDIGLPWLFKLRGQRATPSEVVVVSMDSRSSQQLGLPNKPRKWPRSLHGKLVNNLAANGATTIAFDVIFDEERDKTDNLLFASAIRRAQNVILYQYLKKQPIYQEDSNRKQQVIGITEQLIPPIPILRDAALGLSLFPLPKVPARINHFNLFQPAMGNQATLPVLAQLAHSLDEYEIIARLLKTRVTDGASQLPDNRSEIIAQHQLHSLASGLRKLFLQHAGQVSSLLQQSDGPQPSSQKLQALIKTFSRPDSAYLNFYGPPGSITTIPYYKVLQAGAGSLNVQGKAVFVGFAEEFLPEQADAFYTAFTDPQSGLDISGVEIAATAFANLLDNSVIKAASPMTDIAILLCWGVLLGFSLRILPGQLALPAAIISTALYGGLVYQQFTEHFFWLPFTIPLLIQAPLLVVISLAWQYQDSQRERHNIREAFGYHLPVDVVDQLAQGMNHITDTGQHVYGIVMSTDAERYTSLSERLAPAELRNLINRYYATLFSPIRKAGGVVSDVVGDAALAIWPSSQPDVQKRQQACQAAIDIVKAVDELNKDKAQHALPTRLGLHYGEVVMGHVGAVDHYEYRAVGDIVNTATRIEGLNKLLGTRIIVSEQVLEGVVGFVTRELGKFILLGKQQALTLYELIDYSDQGYTSTDYTLFEQAVHCYQNGSPDEARRLFEEFISLYGEDGPSQYYLALINDNIINEPTETYGVIKLTHK